MQASLSSVCSNAVKAKAQSAGHSTRQRLVVRATTSHVPEAAQPRRAALALLAATIVGLGVVDTAMAGGAPKSTTAASMSGYDMEGTKKRGISPNRKAKLLAKARAAAEKVGKVAA